MNATVTHLPEEETDEVWAFEIYDADSHLAVRHTVSKELIRAQLVVSSRRWQLSVAESEALYHGRRRIADHLAAQKSSSQVTSQVTMRG